MKILFLIILWVISAAIQAETYVQINGASVHDQSGYNGLNYGAGVEQAVAKDWAIAGGWYYNSERRGSGYAYGRYALYKKDSWDIGVAMGAVTGYRRSAVMPMAFPEVCYSYLCAIAIPQVNANGANALALHLRVPI